ncbi:hypothetical protein NE865_01897 [Phthorimaea operculella]|nr:hypothetical protein NE865_01897 [Phthorimaea operculella]
MFSPEKSQVEICLLKSNLEEIENELLVQRSAWPKFDAENEQKFRESLNAVKASRALSVEIEKLTQENVRLVAKRMHLKMQSEEMAKSLEKVREDCSDIENSSNSEKQEIELLVRQYEDLLREKTARFRETRAFFNESEMNREIEKVNEIKSDLEQQVADRRNTVEAMKRQLENLTTDVPENLLDIIGKNELEDKVKSLSKKCDALQKKRNDNTTNGHNPSEAGK